MKQVWLLDKNNFFTGDSIFVKEVEESMTTIPLLVGYIKPKWTGNEWIEGATEEEIQIWEEIQQSDKSLVIKTNEDLTKENEQIWETVEFLLKNTGFIPEVM